MFVCVIDPAHEFVAGGHRASRVVRKAEINEIGVFVRRLRDEIIFRGAAQVN